MTETDSELPSSQETTSSPSGDAPEVKFKDNDGNEITLTEKRLAGFVLIFFTLLSGLYIIGHWPDRLVGSREPIKPLYTYDWFHVRLVGIPDTGLVHYLNDSTLIAEKSGIVKMKITDSDTTAITDSIKKDSNKLQLILKANDSIKKLNIANTTEGQRPFNGKRYPPEDTLIHINTLLMILIAMAGFLGNIIYISTSFTTFLGNGKFKKSWALWYIVKPFTAAGLAVGLYFVFRGGFLNMSDDSSNINIYGVMTLALLTGLFTDRATLKLKEVFDVLLRPKEERDDPLVEDKPEVTNIFSEALEVGKSVTIKIAGKNLDVKPLTIKVEGKEIINAIKTPTEITVDYTLGTELKDLESVKLEITDDKGNAVCPSKQLPVKKENEVVTDVANVDNAGEELDNNILNQEEFGDADSDDDINKPQD